MILLLQNVHTEDSTFKIFVREQETMASALEVFSPEVTFLAL